MCSLTPKLMCSWLFVLHVSVAIYGYALYQRCVDSRRRIFMHYCSIRTVWKCWCFVVMHSNDHYQQVRLKLRADNLRLRAETWISNLYIPLHNNFHSLMVVLRYVMIAHYSIYARIYQKFWIILMIAFCWVFSYGFQLPTLFKVWGKHQCSKLILNLINFFLIIFFVHRAVWIWS